MDYTSTILAVGFPGGSEVKAWDAGDPGLIPGSGRFPREKWHPTPVLLPGESHGVRSLVGYSPRGRKELDTTERLHFHFHPCYINIDCMLEGKTENIKKPK